MFIIPELIQKDGKWAQENLRKLTDQLVWHIQKQTTEKLCLNKLESENRHLRLSSDLYTHTIACMHAYIHSLSLIHTHIQIIHTYNFFNFNKYIDTEARESSTVKNSSSACKKIKILAPM